MRDEAAGGAKVWMCPSRMHVLGLVTRNSSGVRRLLLYRQAVDREAGCEAEEVEVMADVEGYVADVRCSICGRVRTWVPGQEALARMMRGRQD